MKNTEEEFQENMKKAFFDLLENGSEEDAKHFDLYAKPLSQYAWAQEYIPGLIVSSAGGLMPFQAEGLINGYPFYYRNEQNYADIRIGAEGSGNYILQEEALWGASIEFKNVEPAHFIETLTLLLPKLERTLFWYEFEAYKTVFEDAKGKWAWSIDRSAKEWLGARASNVEDAYAQLMEPSEYLIEHGFTAQEQRKRTIASNPGSVPRKQDTRVWPDPMPVFHSTYFSTPEAWLKFKR